VFSLDSLSDGSDDGELVDVMDDLERDGHGGWRASGTA
jgi:hypothetical protein